MLVDFSTWVGSIEQQVATGNEYGKDFGCYHPNDMQSEWLLCAKHQGGHKDYSGHKAPYHGQSRGEYLRSALER